MLISSSADIYMDITLALSYIQGAEYVYLVQYTQDPIIAKYNCTFWYQVEDDKYGYRLDNFKDFLIQSAATFYPNWIPESNLHLTTNLVPLNLSRISS